MKIKLKNFRCYENSEFEFGDSGIVLLSGQSGVGKSTLFMAINFALYGSGTKIMSYGKSSCAVEFESNELIVKRTKRPNRLIVLYKGIEYEDDAGQAIINELYGNSFETTSYVQQNAMYSFMSMSPTDKLSFLETFAFQGIDLDSIKLRVNTVSKRRNEELIAVSSNLEMTEKYFRELNKPKKIKFPLECKIKEREHKILKFLEEFRVVKEEKIRKEASFDKNKTSLNKAEIYEVKFKLNNERLEKIVNNIQEQHILKPISYIGDIEYEELLEELQKCLNYKKTNLLRNQYIEEEKRYKDLCDTDTADRIKKGMELKEKLSQIENNIKKYEDEEEFLSMLEDCRSIANVKNLIEKNRVDNNIEKIRIDLTQNKKRVKELNILSQKLELQKDIYTCPSCKKQLKMSEIENKRELIHVECTIESTENIDGVYEELSKLEKSILLDEKRGSLYDQKTKDLKEYQKQLDVLLEQYEEEPVLKDIEKDLGLVRNLKNTKENIERQLTLATLPNPTIKKLKEQLDKKRNHLEEFGDDISTLDEDAIRERIEEEKGKKRLLETIDKTLATLNKEKGMIETEISILTDSFKEKSFRELKELVEKEEMELKLLNKRIAEFEETKTLIDQYNIYKKDNDIYSEWEKKYTELCKEEGIKRDLFAVSKTLKEKILQAESIALQNIINTINSHAQNHLDSFFPDTPIVVRLTPFKETKKSMKPQITVQIDYKGVDEADLNSLSGGEYARVSLAFSLALAEMFHSPFLMLDECVASLDQESSLTVVDSIKEAFSGKLVLLIGHQVVGGLFDKTIEL